MKKGVVVFLLFISSSLFAEDDSNRYEKVFFAWQFFYSQKADQEINFLNLNPLFFTIDTISFQERYYKPDGNNSSQERQTVISHTRKSDFCGFLGLFAMWTAAIIYHSSLDEPERNVYHDAWEQREYKEKMRQKFIGYNYRNY